MTLKARDRKILMIVAPVLLLVVFWVLILGPKREAATTAKAELTQQRERLEAAEQKVKAAEGAKTDFASDYAAIVRLGKAIPTTVDTPSLIIQLDRAARGTGITFKTIKVSPATAFTAPAGGSSAAASATAAPAAAGAAAPPAAAGGAPAQSGPGKSAEGAGNAVASANGSTGASAAAAGSGSSAAAASGPAAPAAAAAAQPATPPPGLEAVPLEFSFNGRYMDFADFFHRMKRFVHLIKDDRIMVQGRLMTIDSLVLNGAASTSGRTARLGAEVKATVYLTPKAEGATAGATPAGPGTAVPASASPSAPAASSPAPTAAALR